LSYNSDEIRSVIENLEFLTHRPTAEAKQALISDPENL
jgi:hypothetical protein